jgi:hypothetical protein
MGVCNCTSKKNNNIPEHKIVIIKDKNQEDKSVNKSSVPNNFTNKQNISKEQQKIVKSTLDNKSLDNKSESILKPTVVNNIAVIEEQNIDKASMNQNDIQINIIHDNVNFNDNYQNNFQTPLEKMLLTTDANVDNLNVENKNLLDNDTNLLNMNTERSNNSELPIYQISKYFISNTFEFSTENDYTDILKKAKSFSKSVLSLKLLVLKERRWIKELVEISEVI